MNGFPTSVPVARNRVIAIMGALILVNIAAWVAAYIAFADHPLLLGSALIAYGFGLRHAVDADHIAAIDNITRKLMQEGRRPVAVGLFFSLGHASIVVALSFAVALTTHALRDVEGFRAMGGIVATLSSALFLFILAAANLVILWNTWNSFRHARAGGKVSDDDLDMLLSGGGVMARIFRRLFRLIRGYPHIYLLGLLFGLGFDTATEVGLLGLSAASASDGLSPWAIMIFPLLFGAGMALVDTLDGILMLGAYSWAFQNPIRKLYYNLTITALSVAVAIFVGGVETLGLLQDKFALSGGFWTGVAALNDNFGLLGYGIIGLFVTGWIMSVMIYRLRGLDRPQA